MRWDRLFDDLEAQLEQEIGTEHADLLAEEERLRLGRLGLRDRVHAMMPGVSADRPLRVVLADGTRLALALGAVGRDWMAGELVPEASRARTHVIPFAAIAAVMPDEQQLPASIDAAPGDPVAGPLAARLGVTFVLRDLCRRRIGVDVKTHVGSLHGTIDRVARDHLDLAEHDPDRPRRDRELRGVRMLPLAQVLSVRF
ncbi:MAG: hypothetical protein KF727_02365 [Microbacteriaceae bacterium]|nr:hypothetical protein [Microbacteriaceae bacterium]